MRHSWSVLLPNGRTMHVVQLAEGESAAEFYGRALCAVEDRLRKELGIAGTLPKGIRWARWDHYGHPLRKFWTNGLGTVHETTGNPYVDRYVRVPGMFSEADARKMARA